VGQLVDRLRYLISIGGVDVTDDLISAQATWPIGEYQQAQIDLVNDNGKYTTNSTLIPGTSVILSASMDDGVTNYSMFSGEVLRVKTEYTQEGKDTFTIFGIGPSGFKAAQISPCQQSIGPCDIAAVYKGTPTDFNSQSWVTDSRGNYPNGLLYHTDYAYTGETDLYTGTNDVYTKMKLGGMSLFDAFKSFSDTFATTFDANNHVFNVARSPTYIDYTSTAFTATLGDNINAFDLSKDDSEQFDQITMIGAAEDNFFIKGFGSRESVILDSDIADYQTLIVKAKQTQLKAQNTKVNLSLDMVPVPNYLVGKKISIVDPLHGLSSFGNVVEQKHTLNPDRWATSLQCETRKANTVAKLFTEIRTDLDSINKRTSTPVSYLNITASYTNAYGGNNSPLALGYGTSGAYSANVNLVGGMGIRPLNKIVVDPVEGKEYIFASLPANDLRGRLREIVLYGQNALIGAPPGTSSETFSYSRTTPVSGWAPQRTLSSAYPFAVVSVQPDNNTTQSFYWWKPKDCDYVTYYATNGRVVPAGDSPSDFFTLDQWRARATTSYGIDDYSKVKMSRDGGTSPDALEVFSLTGYQELWLYMEIPTNWPDYITSSIVLDDYIGFEVIKNDLAYYIPLFGNASTMVWYYNNKSSSWYPMCYDYVPTKFTEDHSGWGTTSWHIPPATPTPKLGEILFDSDMRIRLAVKAYAPYNTTFSFETSYYFDYLSVKLKANPANCYPIAHQQMITESCSYDVAWGRIATSKPIAWLYSIYLSGSIDGSGNLHVAGEPIWDAGRGGPYGGTAGLIAGNTNLLPLNKLNFDGKKYERGALGWYIDWKAELGKPRIFGGAGMDVVKTRYDPNEGRSIIDILEEQKSVVVVYETDWSVDRPMPLLPSVPPTSYKFDWTNGTLVTGRIQSKAIDENATPYGTPMCVKYVYAQGGPIMRATVSAGRIDQGIPVGDKKVNIMISLVTSSLGPGLASISGVGCANPL